MEEYIENFEDDLSYILHFANQLEALSNIIQNGIYYSSSGTSDNNDINCCLEIFNKEFKELVNKIDKLDLDYYKIKKHYFEELKQNLL